MLFDLFTFNLLSFKNTSGIEKNNNNYWALTSSAERMSHGPSFEALVTSPVLIVTQSVTPVYPAKLITLERLVKDACCEVCSSRCNAVITSDSFPAVLSPVPPKTMNFKSYLCLV